MNILQDILQDIRRDILRDTQLIRNLCLHEMLA